MNQNNHSQITWLILWAFHINKLYSTLNKLPIQLSISKLCDNAISVVDFLKKRGFDDTNVRRIVSLDPRMLNCNVDKTLEPKYELLRDFGFSGSDLVRVISTTPLLQKRVSHVIVNLRDALGSVENVKKFLGKSKFFTSSGSFEHMTSNIALLKNDYGVDIDVIRKAILLHKNTFMRNPEFFKNVVVRVEEELGIPRDSKKFFDGVRLFCECNDKNIESKCQVYKSFGWTEDQVSNMMTRNPAAFMLSEANIRTKLRFLMNELGYNPGFLASRAALLYCSFEKRMLPRYRVFMVLKEKGLLKCCFYTVVKKTETNFMKQFVEPFKEDVPGILEIYQNSRSCPASNPFQSSCQIK